MEFFIFHNKTLNTEVSDLTSMVNYYNPPAGVPSQPPTQSPLQLPSLQ